MLKLYLSNVCLSNIDISLRNRQLTKSLTPGAAILSFIAGVGISSSSAVAAVVTTNCAATNQFCTLQELDNGATIEVGDKLFDNWDVITASNFFPTLPATPLNLNNIEVSGIFEDTNAPGLQFMSVNDELSVGASSPLPGQVTNLIFDFKVTSSGEPLVDNELLLDEFVAVASPIGDSAFINISEEVGTSQGSSNLAQKSVFANVFGGVGSPPPEIEDFDSEVFPPQQSVWVRKNISVLVTGPEASASLNKFSQRFSQVSVPESKSTLSLLALGTLGAALSFKRKLK